MLDAVLTRLTEPAERVPVGWRLLWGGALAGFCVAATLSMPEADPVRAMDGWGLLLLVVPALSASFAALAPGPVLGLAAFAPVGFYAAGYASIFAPAPLTAAVFLAVLSARGPYALGAALAACLGAYAGGLVHGLGPGAAAVGPGWITGWLLAAAGSGEALRKRRQLLAQERLRAEHAARRGAEQERLRIARELHDSLTHSISVINVQASAAAHLLDREPERIPGALWTELTAAGWSWPSWRAGTHHTVFLKDTAMRTQREGRAHRARAAHWAASSPLMRKAALTPETARLVALCLVVFTDGQQGHADREDVARLCCLSSGSLLDACDHLVTAGVLQGWRHSMPTELTWHVAPTRTCREASQQDPTQSSVT
ncbi:sensor histidine kinase [Streptomyces albidoflavus]